MSAISLHCMRERERAKERERERLAGSEEKKIFILIARKPGKEAKIMERAFYIKYIILRQKSSKSYLTLQL